jgi:hypothetical protein
LRATTEALFNRFLQSQAKRHAPYPAEASLLESHKATLGRWMLGNGSLLDAIGTLREGIARDSVTALAAYAISLERECDALRVKAEGNYFGIPSFMRSKLAPTRSQKKPKWSHQLSPLERAERKRLAKNSSDEARRHIAGVGEIERDLERLDFLYGHLLPQLPCLDPILAGQAVGMARGSGNLCALFGLSRKAFPKIPAPIMRRQGRTFLYDHRAFFLVASHLLKAGRWLSDDRLKAKFSSALLTRLTDGGCAPHLADSIFSFVQETLASIRESSARRIASP